MEYRNLMITMALGGLWHGAGILFVLWGVYHGAMLVLYRIVPIDRYLIGRLGAVGKWISIIVTFHLVCFGWILFRAHTDTILPLLQSLRFWRSSPNAELAHYYARGIIALGVVVLATDYLGYRRDVEFPELFRWWNPYVAASFAVACYFGITIFARREAAQFIYFQF
jgi:alginate O-acetyltransferase complex protein AlgI